MAKELKYLPLETDSPKKVSDRQTVTISKILHISAAIIMSCLAFVLVFYVVRLITCNGKLQELPKYKSENKSSPQVIHAEIDVNTFAIKMQSKDNTIVLQKIISPAVSSAKQNQTKNNESNPVDQSSTVPTYQLQEEKKVDYDSAEEDIATTPKIADLSQKETTPAAEIKSKQIQREEDIVSLLKKTKFKNKNLNEDWDEEDIVKAAASVESPKKPVVQLTKNEVNYRSYHHETNIHSDNIVHNVYHYDYKPPSLWDTVQDIPVIGPVVKFIYHAGKAAVDYVKSWF